MDALEMRWLVAFLLCRWCRGPVPVYADALVPHQCPTCQQDYDERYITTSGAQQAEAQVWHESGRRVKRA